MAIPVRTSNTTSKTFVTVTSRYYNSDVLVYGNNKILTFETYKRNDIETSAGDRYAVVPPGEEYRPDLTSFRAYGTVDYWWLILEANKIKDIFDYKANINIRIPSPYNSI